MGELDREERAALWSETSEVSHRPTVRDSQPAFRQLFGIFGTSGLCLELLSVIQGVCLTVFDRSLRPEFDLLSQIWQQTGGHVDRIPAFVQTGGDDGSSGGRSTCNSEERA